MNKFYSTLACTFSLLLLGTGHSGIFNTVSAESDKFGIIEKVPAKPSPHWLWVHDPNFISFSDGRAHLIDGDSGRYMGSLNTGYVHLHLTLPSHYREIYSAETYYSRHVGGTRTDLVRVYDPVNLSLLGEIKIPNKRASVFPRLNHAALTDDNRFMVVFNLTPATSVTVVNTETREFVSEIDVPGCSLLLPAGGYRFLSICADGTALKFTLSADGREASKEKSPAFFDMNKDAVTEGTVRYKDQWLFPSVESMLYSVNFSKDKLEFDTPWSLVNDRDRADEWRTGGMQQLAVSEPYGMLYSIMHQGTPDTYEHAGPEIWVYDIKKQKRIKRIKTERNAVSIHVSPDDKPLLFALTDEEATLDIYDARSGKLLRTVEELGITPWLMQTPPYNF